MKRGNIQKQQQNRVSLEPSLFMFPLINSNKIKKSFIIKTHHHPNTLTTKTLEVNKLQIVHHSKVQLTNQTINHNNLIVTTNKSQTQQNAIHKPNQIVKHSQNIENKANHHEIEHSIGGTSVYQFSEIDKSDLLMENIEQVISNHGSLLQIIDQIQLADVLEMKSIYSKIVSPLFDELNDSQIRATQWFKGFALLVSIFEESLFRHEIAFEYNFQHLIENNKHIVDILSNFIDRMGQQIQFVREEKLDSFISLFSSVIVFILPQIDIDEINIERIIKGCNLCFRIKIIRDRLKYLLESSDEQQSGRCGKVIIQMFCSFQRIKIPYFGAYNFKSSYLLHVEFRLNNNLQ